MQRRVGQRKAVVGTNVTVETRTMPSIKRLCFFAICIAWFGWVHAEDLNESVVRVVAFRGGQAAISTGFFFRVDGRIGVMTALHGVVGANRITIKNDGLH